MKKSSETMFQRICLAFVLPAGFGSQTLSGKRDSDLRLPYALLVNDFPLICRVHFLKWDTGGDILRNPFLTAVLP